MIRRPPRSTRTDTLFPYTTLFRPGQRLAGRPEAHPRQAHDGKSAADLLDRLGEEADPAGRPGLPTGLAIPTPYAKAWMADPKGIAAIRPEERRVGKEGVSPCRSRWSPYY